MGANELRLTARAQNANNVATAHPKDGFPQPGGTTGISLVTEHHKITVKSIEGFFPTGNLMIFTVDSGGAIVGAELASRVIGNAAAKLPSVGANDMTIATRGGSKTTFQPTTVTSHAAGSVVISAATQLTCRAKSESPVPAESDGILDDPIDLNQSPSGSSVGTFSVCYTRLEPGGPPDPGGTLDQPLVGSTLIVLNALNQPFLSTGGFNHILYGVVPHVDTNGTTDGALHEISPCITEFTPGSNLQVTLNLSSVDKSYGTPDSGTIRVVTDTVHDDVVGNADDCDDPAGEANITLVTYIYPGDGDTSDDDTDGDGCTDDRELDNNVGTGGRRDPWNPGDFFDANKDLSVTTVDIFAVAAKFGATSGGGPPYSVNHDRGLTYGPFGHNLSPADGAIAIPDIFAVASQFGHAC
jgi:hypothetical protein